MRLQAGQAAPDFSMPDISGQMIRPGDYRGRFLLLSFYRYASCPFCNLRVHELKQRLPEFGARQLSLVAVFQSARAGILEYVGRQQPAFPLIPDPEQVMYRRFRVESSLAGFVKGLALRAGRAVQSMRAGFLPGRMDGSKTRVPADFLIGPEGRILTAYYGKDISDHLPIDEIFRQLDDVQPAARPERIAGLSCRSSESRAPW